MEGNKNNHSEDQLTKVTGMYKEWFLDYASYVILERAIPSLEDGLKPVQRRILHSMKELDDGRYNKVANIVGHTMQYHPHGDASISDAMVQLAQKDLLIDMQGNWGNILTGDKAAASRYIEARLSKFALEVVFNPKVTNWQLSYDGRKKEPIHLPIKFPLLLVQGVEGIAVGLSTKILPHNFNEVIQASISYLNGKSFELFPDFQTAGLIDVEQYNDGKRGGKVRIRAQISIRDKSTIVISQIPFGVTTGSLIDSILKANDKSKIKIKKVEDNTSSEVEILVYLPNGISPDKTIEGLYAFTLCENTISPLSCIINNNKPEFIGVSEILKQSVDRTVALLKLELEIQLNELNEHWHFASLERIFIENKVYREIEEQESWEGVINAIDEGLKPFVKILKREITEEDIIRLTEIRIKRISKFDIDKAQEKIEALEGEIEEVKNDLAHLIDFAIQYFTHLKKVYGKTKSRTTLISKFDGVDAQKAVVRNLKLYINKEDGFVGTGLKKDEYVCECSDIDDVITFSRCGNMKISKIDTKLFVEKDLIYASVFKKKDTRQIYNIVYQKGKVGPTYIKRFYVSGVTRDRVYNLTDNDPESKILYFSANPNGEAEIVKIVLRNSKKLKKLKWEIDFAEIQIKSRNVRGNLVSKHSVHKVELAKEGVSTLKARKLWFDEITLKLNTEQRGELLGSFEGNNKLLIIDKRGIIKIQSPELSTYFETKPMLLQKWDATIPVTAIYYDEVKKISYVKRFIIESEKKKDSFLREKTKLIFVTALAKPVVNIVFKSIKGKTVPNRIIDIEEFIEVKGYKSIGNQLSGFSIKAVELKSYQPIKEEVLSSKEDLSSTEEGNQIQLDI